MRGKPPYPAEQHWKSRESEIVFRLESSGDFPIGSCLKAQTLSIESFPSCVIEYKIKGKQMLIGERLGVQGKTNFDSLATKVAR
ncbi:unnamed protein product [Rotaria magnacalcarata]|uniref:Uncharacterized protein n=1 Tax=Rotaria magnacalcarata TaxID=392030 RepID=A0A8S2J4Z4_9BILA|nr:unnamed protein product [Rotaria magnacalcarata]CAF3793511.1 unnamed protein product [Rotaria magnacalcarata]CAF3803627.1 unnamed protein product [Rotaria magnacalcarata]